MAPTSAPATGRRRPSSSRARRTRRASGCRTGPSWPPTASASPSRSRRTPRRR
ncbi:hypothetical protein GTY23_03975 [Streptomyces sp. SID5998]|nr:hypothetical protein [Streptomyces sp. SID5998]